ncbi:MAG: diadenylate cyclase [Patescibacteria group bacterium]
MNLALVKNFGPASIIDGLRGVSFTFSDSLDILFVAILIYAVLKLVSETRSFPVIFGISTVFVFYGLATVLNLTLTRNIIQSFLSIFLILIVVIFQNEFRRFLTYFNLAPRFSKKMLPSHVILETLAETVGYFAKKKTGALLVFPGKEAIDQHLSGGYDLDGEISAPLIVSIFDESTPGHDGAIVIKGNRLSKFGVHLPLAKNIESLHGYGTRHRAALGLSERSDALIVVISEERGTISIAEQGRLRNLKDEDELEKIVKRFYRVKFPRQDISYLAALGAKNIALVFFTLVLSIGIWVYQNQNSPIVQKNFVIPLEFQNVPPLFIVNDAVPEEVVLTLEARGGNFQDLNADEIRVPIDLTNARTGWRQFLIDKEKIKVPFNFTLVKVDPEKVSLQIAKKEVETSSQLKARP